MALNQLGDGSSDGCNSAAGLAAFGKTPPSAAPSGSGNAHTVAAGSTTAVYTNTTFDGGVGSSAYTVGDLVAILKSLGLIAE